MQMLRSSTFSLFTFVQLGACVWGKRAFMQNYARFRPHYADNYAQFTRAVIRRAIS